MTIHRDEQGTAERRAPEQQGKGWFCAWQPITGAPMRLFCFAYAGGSATVFRNWQRTLGAAVEVCPVELPGHWARRNEPLCHSLPGLVQELAADLEPYCDRSIALFGHSMGALVAFELARAFRRRGVLVEQVHVSARGAPQLPPADLSRLHELDDARFVAAVQSQFGGIPASVLSEPELVALIVPVLRADLQLVHCYRYSEEAPLECPIFVYGGAADRCVSRAALEPWSQQTRAGVCVELFEGDHFYVTRDPGPLLTCLGRRLCSPNSHEARSALVTV